MVFKRLLGSLGVGGPAVDTVLDPGAVTPGGQIGGQVLLRGGGAEFTIEHITLELIARVESEHAEGESEGVVVFHRHVVGGHFRLGAEEERSVPFSFPLPWETPITELHGQSLGLTLGVRTELGIAGARDKGDLDPLTVRPLPAQEAVLEAFGELGFGFKSADLELGHIGGSGQQLPFYQEIELIPSPRYAHRMKELEVTFLAGPGGLDVVLEADRRGGFLSDGDDALSLFTVGHQDAGRTDWATEVDGWIGRLLDRHAGYDAVAAHHAYEQHHGHDPYASHHGHEGHDGHRKHDGGHGSGPGMGTAIAAGAAGLAVGVVGGMVAAEVVDEVGDFFEGDDEDDDAGEED
ncbi:sporulation protein [Streptomyces laurentii]|uniref:sporulation protein n=1 Tax=Streptomyces laurentii TaxID=39478 RepID=UPI0033FFF3D3